MPRSQPSDDADDGDSVGSDVEYGIHRARRDTTLLHRDSSSLYPSQFMEMEYYLAATQHSLFMVIPFIHLLVHYDSVVFRLLALWQWMVSPLATLQTLGGW